MNHNATITLTLSPAEVQSLGHFVQNLEWEHIRCGFDDDDALAHACAALDHLRDQLWQAGYDDAPRLGFVHPRKD
jgi:hypothetical protein